MKKSTYFFLLINLFALSCPIMRAMQYPEPLPAYTPQADTSRVPKVFLGCVLMGAVTGALLGMINLPDSKTGKLGSLVLTVLGVGSTSYFSLIHARYSYPQLWREQWGLANSCMILTGVATSASASLTENIRKSFSG